MVTPVFAAPILTICLPVRCSSILRIYMGALDLQCTQAFISPLTDALLGSPPFGAVLTWNQTCCGCKILVVAVLFSVSGCVESRFAVNRSTQGMESKCCPVRLRQGILRTMKCAPPQASITMVVARHVASNSYNFALVNFLR